jgi:hypothetical protein
VEPVVAVEGQLGLAGVGEQVLEGAAGVPLPPRAFGLALQPGGVSEELPQAHPAQRRAGQVLVQPVVEVETPLIAEPEDHRGGQALGDRPEPELQVTMWDGRLAGPTDVGYRPVADHGRDQRGGPAVGLGAGDQLIQLVGGPGREHGSA